MIIGKVYRLNCESPDIVWHKDHTPWNEVYVKCIKPSYKRHYSIVLMYLDKECTILHEDHREPLTIFNYHVMEEKV